MALAIDGSTPAVATQNSATVATVTTASFTPPAGSTLLVLYSANTIDPTSPATPTITDSLGGHLTYTLSDFSARADTPSADGQAAIWTAPVVTSAAMTITVTNQAASGGRHAALAVIVLTGAHATPVGAHGKSGSTSAASIAQSYTAQATNGWGFISVIDWSAKGAMSAGTGCTLIGSANLGTPDITYGFVRRTTADDSNGGSNTLNVTLGGTSTSLRWAYVEIVPAAGTATMPPRSPARRRFGAPELSRTRVFTPVRGQVNPPFPFAQVKQPRRLRGLLPRRGEPAKPVPPQVPPPPFVPQAPHAKVKPAPVRHRAAPAVPPPQLGTTQPARARLKLPKPARARIGLPAPPQIVLTPPGYVPQGLRARIRSLRLPRGRTVTPVPAQIVLTAPAYPPQTGRPHSRLLRYFRGRASVPPQVAPVPPPAARARQVLDRPIRRAHPVTPPARQEPAPLFTRIKPRALRLFRGKTRPVVPAQIILVPPPYPLQSVRGKKRLWSLRRRRAGMEGWLVGAAASPGDPCSTLRPGTGTTARPGTGITSYSLGTTTRPGTGITARPDSGVTEDPC